MSIFRSYRTKEKVSVGLMWGINLATLLYVMIEYPNLPDIIPHHYGFFGEPDEWGGKWMLSRFLFQRSSMQRCTRR